MDSYFWQERFQQWLDEQRASQQEQEFWESIMDEYDRGDDYEQEND